MNTETNLKLEITHVLQQELAPILGLDSAALEVLNVSGGVVQVRLGGCCPSCPGTLMAIIHGMEEELRWRFPGIKYLEVLS
jgi:Fe-S cluster biogenesis protein NfuA